jgi:hypothetical protein
MFNYTPMAYSWQGQSNRSISIAVGRTECGFGTLSVIAGGREDNEQQRGSFERFPSLDVKTY